MLDPVTIFGLMNASFAILCTTLPIIVTKKDQLLRFNQHTEQCRALFVSCNVRYNLWAASLGGDGNVVDLSALLEAEEDIKRKEISVREAAELVKRRLSLTDSKFSKDEWVEDQLKRAVKGLRKLPRALKLSHPARESADNAADRAEDVEQGYEEYAIVWQEYFKELEEQRGNPTSVPRPKRGVLRRIRWLLWRDGQLHKCLTDLSTALNTLIQFTDDIFVWRGLGRIGTQNNPQNSVKFIEYARAIRLEFVDTWNNVPEQQWAVRLAYPSKEDEGHAREQIVDMLNLSFAVRVPDGIQSKSIQLDWNGRALPAEASHAEIQRKLAHTRMAFLNNERSSWLVSVPARGATFGARVERSEEESRRWSQSVRNVLCATTVDNSLAAVFLKERTDMAQQLGFWLPLLWTTGLTDRLCSCGIRGVVREKNKLTRTLDAKFRSKTAPHKLEYGFRSQYFGERPQSPCPSFLADDLRLELWEEDRKKLFATGNLLAELIIGRPIDNPRLNQKQKSADNDMPVSLQEVSENSFDQYNMRNVVRYCFEYDSQLLRGRRDLRAKGGQILHYHEQERFRRIVTQP